MMQPSEAGCVVTGLRALLAELEQINGDPEQMVRRLSSLATERDAEAVTSMHTPRQGLQKKYMQLTAHLQQACFNACTHMFTLRQAECHMDEFA